MKVLFIHEKVNASGSVERVSSQFDQPEVLIGRGGTSHIFISNPRLSLVHARLYQEDGRISISDLNSLSGVRVNNTRVGHAVLSSGDTIQLADFNFIVQISGGLVTLTLRTVAEDALSGAEFVARNAAKLEVDSYLPRMRVLSFVGAIVVVVAWFVYPILGDSYKGWNSGPISNAHRMIQNDCQQCHLTPFEQVQDRECLNCHTMSEHAKGYGDFVAQHVDLGMRCAECHMEHNGNDALILHDARVCVSCHGGMKDLKKDSDILDVVNFASHPQFRISVADSNGQISRVSIDDTAQAIDTTPIKLNHAVHLKEGLRGPRGPETLQCNACHKLSQDKTAMLPISFDKHCRDCHGLGFDERLPDSQVPHGDVDVVYPTLFAEYAKLLLLEGGKGAPPKVDVTRSLPEGSELPLPTEPLSPDAQLVQVNARIAEEELFTRTGCFLCHDYKEKPSAEQRFDQTRYTISKPHIPDVWMTKARFDHGAHEEVSCESCHEKTRKSTDTKELLLPSIKVCRECHMQGAKPGFVESDCTQCHVYHAALEVPREKKQNLTEFLNSLTR
jgi:hypothetical protein